MFKNIISRFSNIFIILILVIALVDVSIFVMPPQKAHASDYGTYNGKWIKVGLKYSSSAVKSASLSAEGGFIICRADEDGIEELLPLPAYESIEITYDGGFKVTDTDGTLISSDIGADGVILPLAYEDDVVLKFGSARYRGGIMFSVNSNSSINVINYLPLEEYLYGVINAEMSHGCPLEALKAQAVTARSYVICNEGRHKAYGFDICSNTHCQMYKGYDGEYAETTRAVEETSGLVLWYADKVVSGFYSKNSGGHTENSEDVWGGKEGYLRGVKDEYSPAYPWSVAYSFDDIEKKLANAGYDIGELESIEVVSRHDSGSVDKIEFVGSSGSKTLKFSSVQSIFGASVIKSGMFTVDNNKLTYTKAGLTSKPQSAETSQASASAGSSVSAGSSAVSAKALAINVKGNDGCAKLSLGSGLYAIGNSGKAQKLSSNEIYVVSASGVEKLSAAENSGESEVKENTANDGKNDKGSTKGTGIDVKITEGTVYFNGLGYGHGVGMPQDSAIEMAKQGFDYQAILKYYYTDIEIADY